ncbi:MAG: two-component regulator propeller domain-containing protein [Bacteroidota bacterium]
MGLLCGTIALLAGCLHMSYGQPADLRFERFGLKEGLPNMSIQTLYQDEEGFLWIGTWDGLSRYDGYGFENFHHRPFDSTSLSANDVKAIAEDGRGRLFVGMQSGLSRWDEQKQEFVQYPLERGVPGKLSNDAVGALMKDDEGNMMVGGFLGKGPHMNRLIIDKDSFQNARGPFTTTMVRTQDGVICGGRSSRLAFWSFAADSTIPIQEMYPGLVIPKQDILSLLEDHRGHIWVGTKRWLIQYRKDTQVMRYWGRKDGLLHPWISALYEDKQRRIWIGTGIGLQCLSEDRTTLGTYQYQAESPFSLSHNHVTALLEDRSGNLWVGTMRGGLNKARLARLSQFHRYDFTHFGEKHNDLIVFAFAEGANNRLWVGTSNGLWLLDKASKDTLAHYTYGPEEELGLSARNVFSLHETPDEQLIIGYSRFEGADLLDIPSQTMKHVPENKEKPNFYGTVRDIDPVEGSPGQYWLTGQGQFLFDIENLSIERVSICNGPDDCFKNYFFEAKAIDSCRIWISGNEGILERNQCDSRFQVIPLQVSGKRATNLSISIHPVPNGDVWIGGYGTGLFQLNPINNEIKHYEMRHGLPNNFVYGIISDAFGNLWMSTNKGLTRFSPDTEFFTLFDVDDGLPHYEFATGAYMQARDGEVYFGGMDGFVSFYPSQIQERSNRFDAPTHISEVRVSGELVMLDTVGGKEASISFPAYRGQHLEIEFVSLDFTRPENNQYRHMLQGWDEDWSPRSDGNRVQYNLLEPGDYTFLVQGSNSDGVFSTTPASLRIQVIPLWHQNLWIRFILPLLFALGLGYIGYRRLQYLRGRERRRLQHRIAKVRQEALASQMDHHFTFNSLNSIQRFVTENDTQSALYFISRFGKLMRRMLNQARQNYITIEEEIDTLDLYLSLESLRTRNKFSYEFQVDPNLDIYNTEMPANLLQPYVENAIWHGLMPKEEQGSILLTFSLHGKDILIILEDDGIGRKKSRELQSKSKFAHKSRGMKINEERLETLKLLHGDETKITIIDLEDEEGKGTGTKVKVIVPNRV